MVTNIYPFVGAEKNINGIIYTWNGSIWVETGNEEYWFDGVTFGSGNTSLDTGTEEFWFEGQPITFLLELSAPSSNVQGSFFPFFDTF